MSIIHEETTMESSQFDAALGGNEHLPLAANSLKFAASRSIEIAAMTESILRPSKTKLIFQSLPVHMRRRVMSHNCKRLPRKLRSGHLEQMKKSGLPPKQKRPSRKYRRRPGNLLEEYNRRQKRCVWLETHIWHAKRFHMIERWGHKLAYAPCDKAFRACYRASSAHCLLQDISYVTPIQISGPVDKIKEMFNSFTTPSSGLGICAKAFLNGTREGHIHMYKANSYPNGYIGKINFIWIPSIKDQTLWLFVHLSHVKEVESVLIGFLFPETQSSDQGIPEKRRKLVNSFSDNIKIKVLPGIFNRFRLIGPNSHAVLTRSLKCVDSMKNIASGQWISKLPGKTELHLTERNNYWQEISKASSPSQLPPRIIVSLIVKDPRLSRPKIRTKAVPENNGTLKTETLISVPQHVSSSPLWNTEIHETIKKEQFTNHQFIVHITKTQLVPGEVFEDDPALQCVPVVLVQRPGSQNARFKKLGYGSGWDIIVPAGYGMPFWQTFIMFGGRSGGLRESESVAFEMGECYLPPDSNAGKEEENRLALELKDKYFRLPPSKRVNYTKIAVNSPFICHWNVLLQDWNNGRTVQDFFVLRDRSVLDTLQECLNLRKAIPQLKNGGNCLVPVYLQVTGKGNLKRHALICLPQASDVTSMKTLFEPHHQDPNEKVRRQKRAQHCKDIKRWRRNRVKQKKKGTALPKKKVPKRIQKEPSEYVKSMRELWLPTEVKAVRYSASRELLGYLSQGAFSFSEARSCGVGYVAYNGLSALLNSRQNNVLVRNTTSRKYRLANIQIVKNV